jgi:DNA-binding transcriptional ArsR family regulator
MMILSLMEQYSDRLDGIFQALADPTRRAVLARLGRGPASISDLARPFEMALPSFMKHIHYLEGSGLIRTRKEGRVRTCVIEKKQFAAVEAWLTEQRGPGKVAPTGLSSLSSPLKRREKHNDPIF